MEVYMNGDFNSEYQRDNITREINPKIRKRKRKAIRVDISYTLLSENESETMAHRAGIVLVLLCLLL